ncbi:phage tail tape measure protein [Microvirga sp. SM9]|uniref:phage tail tape measure protein n=1 Tax=Microvirga lenta TaxID=2881337 RepID=UPI001CFFB6C0|nr:phage tail tape measure protein [Microvirga lenta]MCB5176276.1 phage tail tape measure protein [Microvirga lenta]
MLVSNTSDTGSDTQAARLRIGIRNRFKGDRIVADPIDFKNTQKEVFKDKDRQLNTLIGLSDRFGESMASAFAKNIAEGKKFDDVLKNVRQTFTQFALRSAIAPLQNSLTKGLQSLLGGIFDNSLSDGSGLSDVGKGIGSFFGSLFGGGQATALAQGGVLSRGMVMPFAQGGVVGAPTYFPLGRGLGLMGERGAEAVMPLARGPDGRLGVQAGGAGRSASITVNIATPDAESFRRSEAQVSAALARAVARGQRGM